MTVDDTGAPVAPAPLSPDGHHAHDAFTVTFRRDETRSVVTVAGELDLATAPQLSGVLACLARSLDGDLELDAAALSFCDCTGLFVLLDAARRRQRQGHRFALTNPPSVLRRLADIAGVENVLGITAAGTLA